MCAWTTNALSVMLTHTSLQLAERQLVLLDKLILSLCPRRRRKTCTCASGATVRTARTRAWRARVARTLTSWTRSSARSVNLTRTHPPTCCRGTRPSTVRRAQCATRQRILPSRTTTTLRWGGLGCGLDARRWSGGVRGPGSGGRGWRALGWAQCLRERGGVAAVPRPCIAGFRSVGVGVRAAAARAECGWGGADARGVVGAFDHRRGSARGCWRGCRGG